MNGLAGYGASSQGPPHPRHSCLPPCISGLGKVVFTAKALPIPDPHFHWDVHIARAWSRAKVVDQAPLPNHILISSRLDTFSPVPFSIQSKPKAHATGFSAQYMRLDQLD